MVSALRKHCDAICVLAHTHALSHLLTQVLRRALEHYSSPSDGSMPLMLDHYSFFELARLVMLASDGAKDKRFVFFAVYGVALDEGENVRDLFLKGSPSLSPSGHVSFLKCWIMSNRVLLSSIFATLSIMYIVLSPFSTAFEITTMAYTGSLPHVGLKE